jgi:hypothetical protein
LPDGEKLRSTMKHLEAFLTEHLPLPEADLVGLSKAVARTGESKANADLRRLVIDIDDFCSQIRWHIGQAVLLYHMHPEIAEPRSDLPDHLRTMPIANAARLTLRGLTIHADPVFFDRATEARRGGTAGGWIFHMMLDSAIMRTVSALDRIARAAALIGHVEFSNDKVYFRSGKLSVIHRELQLTESQRLLDISEEEPFTFLLDYRDGLSHRTQQFSRPLGLPPGDSYTDETGTRVLVRDPHWRVEDLLGIAIGGDLMVMRAIKELRLIAEALIPIPDNWPV